MIRKMIALIITLSLIFSIFCISGFSTDFTEINTSVIELVDATGTSMTIDVDSYNEVVAVSEDVAKETAMLFVQNMVMIDNNIAWDEKTEVTEVVPMFDTSGNVSAYTICLTSGYAVVSAYMDTPSIVTEWSDITDPVIENFDISESGNILYLGANEYYFDDGSENVENVYGEVLPRVELHNSIEESRAIDYLPNQVLDTIIDNSSSVSINTTLPRDVTDPFVDASTWYRGPFVCNDYCNKWENYIKCYTMSDASGYQNHCVPTALTSAIRTYAARYPSYMTVESSWLQTLSTIRQIGYNNAIYDNINGTYPEDYDDYAIAAFENYNVDVSTTTQKVLGYTSLKSDLSANRLLLVGIEQYDTDVSGSGHAVLCYAYTRLYSSTSSTYVTYIKTADGNSNNPRYFDVNTLGSLYGRTTKYYAIIF